ncbi:hypothetical protein V6N12_015060 [Hibiscus sabdariffa]|uniref:Tryptophan synthase beta chain-like PALP domain-containing protein n=1 Tax=Hibiscus sabdariffa TaxID=183260 RepID=A0ABR2DQ18_9ROSI
MNSLSFTGMLRNLCFLEEQWGMLHQALLKNLKPMERIGLSMVSEAEDRGAISPGKTKLAEPTSGNTGLEIAFVAATKGYKLIVTMPASINLERRILLRAFGAEIVLTDPEKACKGLLIKLKKLFLTLHMLSCFNSFIMWLIQRFILKLQDQKYGRILWVMSTYLLLELELVDLFGFAVSIIKDFVAGYVPSILDVNLLDEVIKVSNDEAIDMARRLALEEGLLVGISSGAAAAAAISAKRPENTGKLIVVRKSSLNFLAQVVTHYCHIIL